MPTANLLLASLPASDCDRLRRRLEPVTLRSGEILHAPGNEIRHAFFITSGLVALEYAAAEGDSVELVAVGREGMIGVPLVLYDLAVPYRAVARARGSALRIQASALQTEWRSSQTLHDTLLAYAGRVLQQVSQAAICRQAHSVLPRLCRWLLTCEDHLGTGPIAVTQEDLASALGTARKVVMRALHELQDADAIWCHYGRILIRKRPMLESTACECYRAAVFLTDARG